MEPRLELTHRSLNLVPRVSHLPAPWSGGRKMRDPGNEVVGHFAPRAISFPDISVHYKVSYMKYLPPRVRLSKNFKDGAYHVPIPKYFCVVYDYAGKADLSKAYWNPKRKLGVTTQFSEIIKQ